MIQLSSHYTYDDLRAFLGPDGSFLPVDTEPPKGLEMITFIEGGLAEADIASPAVAGVCFVQPDPERSARVWLAEPVEVASVP